MNFYELIILAFALSMDSFVASLCKGMEVEEVNLKKCLLLSLIFSFIQMFFPLIGFFLANILKGFINNIDHWIAFIILSYLAWGFYQKSKSDMDINIGFEIKSLIFLAIATSIDAFAVGITYKALSVPLFLASIITFTITFVISLIGVKLGNKISENYQKKALTLGGILLFSLGIKILLSHLF